MNREKVLFFSFNDALGGRIIADTADKSGINNFAEEIPRLAGIKVQQFTYHSQLSEAELYLLFFCL